MEESFFRGARESPPNTRTTRARSTGAVTRCRMCSCRATTRGSANGGGSRAAPGGGGSSRHLRYHAPSTRDGSNGRVFCAYVRSDRQHREGAAASSPRPSRRAIVCAFISRSWRAPGAVRRCSRASCSSARAAACGETFTVRKQSFGVGVERTFQVHSPKIERIEVAARGDVRRAKLYYLRERVGRASRVRERRWSGAEEVIQPGLIAEEGAMPADETRHAPGEDEQLAEQAAAEEAAAEEAAAEGTAPAAKRPRRPSRHPRRPIRHPRRPIRRRWRTPTPRATTTSRAPRARAPGRSPGGVRRSNTSTTRSSSWSRSWPSRSAWRSASRPSS